MANSIRDKHILRIPLNDAVQSDELVFVDVGTGIRVDMQISYESDRHVLTFQEARKLWEALGEVYRFQYNEEEE